MVPSVHGLDIQQDDCLSMVHLSLGNFSSAVRSIGDTSRVPTRPTAVALVLTNFLRFIFFIQDFRMFITPN